MMKKDVGVAYLLWFFLGVVGGHKFYVGKVGMGILYIFTFGLFGIGLLVDLFTLAGQVREYNYRLTNRGGITINNVNNVN